MLLMRIILALGFGSGGFAGRLVGEDYLADLQVSIMCCNVFCSFAGSWAMASIALYPFFMRVVSSVTILNMTGYAILPSSRDA